MPSESPLKWIDVNRATRLLVFRSEGIIARLESQQGTHNSLQSPLDLILIKPALLLEQGATPLSLRIDYFPSVEIFRQG